MRSPRFLTRALLLAALAAALCAACLLPSRAAAARRRDEAGRLLDELGLEGEAAQVLMVGVSGSRALSAESRALLGSMPLGAVLLFGRNVPDEPAGLGALTAELQAAAAGAALGIPLIVALDHEGGSVFRFRGEGITRLPPPLEVGARGPRYARALGEAAGRELKALGVNMNLAPVVELLDERNESFLGDRSYGREAARVDAAAGAFIEGLQARGTAAVAKHFPGNESSDPHRGAALLDVDREGYERGYRPRFEAAARAGVAAVMASHAIVPALDPERPATLSRAALAGELRGRIGFRGLILTDDLYMKAISAGSPPELAAVEALAAGADLLMLSSGSGAHPVRAAIVRAVEEGRLPRSRLRDAARRVLELKLRFGMAQALDPRTRAEALAAYPGLVEEDARAVAAALSASRGEGRSR